MTPADSLLAALLSWLRPLVHQPFRPDPFALTLTQEQTPMGVVFDVSATLPVLTNPDPNDVATQELTVAVNGTAQPSTNPALTAASVDLGQFPLGTAIAASLVYIDASGNRGPARVESITVSDTVPPAEPADFALVVTQVTVPDAPPAPTPAPAP